MTERHAAPCRPTTDKAALPVAPLYSSVFLFPTAPFPPRPSGTGPAGLHRRTHLGGQCLWLAMATDDIMDSATRDWTSRKEGPRRTIYFTKKLPGSANSYARTGQYLGDWKANQYDGKGTFESANGTRYVGDWVAGKREGSGTLWVKVKGELHKRYVGQWSENHPHGRGVYYYPNGDNYSGEWKKGVRHGAGTLQAKAGVYEGAFFNNKKHGFGVLDLPNGDHFEGMFVEDMKEGEGVYFYFDKDRKTHTKRCGRRA